jgi:hypothetical protein
MSSQRRSKSIEYGAIAGGAAAEPEFEELAYNCMLNTYKVFRAHERKPSYDGASLVRFVVIATGISG